MDEVRMDRRKFLGGAAGVGAAAALASWAPGALSKPGGPKAPIVFKDTLVCQHFSVRDATARLDKSVMGHLGGPNYPQDPTDLGPLVPLPGGFAEVFDYLASVGVRGFEFFQSTQNVQELGRQPTAAEIRQYLDAAEMKATGTHQFGLGNLDPATGNLTTAGETLFEFLSTLGMEEMGFSGNLSQLPNNPPNPASPGTTLPNASGWVEDYVNPVTGVRTFGFR